MKRFAHILVRSIGPLLFLLILLRVDLNELLRILSQAELFPVLGAIALLIPILAARAFRWFLLLREQNVEITFAESLAVYAFGVALGTFTPGRVGELAKVYYVRPRTSSYGSAFSSVLVDRLMEMVVISLVAVAGATVYLGNDVAFRMTAVSVVALGLIALLIIALSFYLVRFAGNEDPGASDSLKRRIQRNGKALFLAIRQTDKKILAVGFLITICTIASNYFAIYLCTRAIYLPLSYPFVCFASSVTTFVSMFPITVLGIGTRDALLVVLIVQQGGTEAGGVAFSTLILMLLLVHGALSALSIFWLPRSDRDPGPHA
jgi:uncharacterized protein (TIRG00374 family)